MDDVDKTIKVGVNSTEDRGNEESLTRAGTDTVVASPDPQDIGRPSESDPAWRLLHNRRSHGRRHRRVRDRRGIRVKIEGT